MLLDFDDYRPEIARIPSPISVREGVLLSLVLHLLIIIFLLVAPDSWFEPPPEVLAQSQIEQAEQRPLRFIEVVPLRDRPAPPRAPADQSDMDRRAATRERAPLPENMAPLSRGNTPEPVVGGPTERSPAAGSPAPPAPPAAENPAPPLPDRSRESVPLPSERPPQPTAARQPPGNAGRAFENLEQYLREDNHENSRGGEAEQSADIQFDAMGVDFGPWLRRFKNQVERNWIVPKAVQSFSGDVVIRFGVMRNGTIVGLTVLQPGPISALTQSSVNALTLSNPTAKLPPEYPVEPAIFTVTFQYRVIRIPRNRP